MRRVRGTQREGWESIKDDLGDRHRKVLGEIDLTGGLTTYEIGKRLGWTINRISGRVTELVDKGILMDSGEKRINPDSRRRCIVWKRKDQNQQIEMF